MAHAFKMFSFSSLALSWGVSGRSVQDLKPGFVFGSLHLNYWVTFCISLYLTTQLYLRIDAVAWGKARGLKSFMHCPGSATDNPIIYVTRSALPISLLYFDRGQNRPFMEKEDNGYRIVTLKSNMRVSMEHTRHMMRLNN